MSVKRIIKSTTAIVLTLGLLTDSALANTCGALDPQLTQIELQVRVNEFTARVQKIITLIRGQPLWAGRLAKDGSLAAEYEFLIKQGADFSHLSREIHSLRSSGIIKRAVVLEKPTPDQLERSTQEFIEMVEHYQRNLDKKNPLLTQIAKQAFSYYDTALVWDETSKAEIRFWVRTIVLAVHATSSSILF